MSKFKVGDRVRYLPCKDASDQAWQNMTITKIDDGGYWGNDDNPDYVDGYFPYPINETLELIPPPIPAPIAERMRGLIERMAGKPVSDAWVDYAEARAIMAKLVPVDPDLLEARELCCADIRANHPDVELEDGYRIGECDKEDIMRIALAAIRKGREIERDGRK